MGPWSAVKVDPGVWGLGFDMGVLQYQVRAATQRLLQSQCSSLVGWVPGVGMRPRLWRDSVGQAAADSLPQLESGQKRTYQDLQSGAARAAADNFSDAAQMAAYHASWMDPSPPRQLPRQRVATRAALVTAQRQQQEQQQQQLRVDAPAVNDLEDPLTGQQQRVDTSGMPWLAAYSRAAASYLPRDLRVFAWRLLHAAVRVGAARMHAYRAQPDRLLQCTCQQQQCQQQAAPPLETLSHAFVDCPTTAAVWAWFAGVWSRVQPGAAPDVSSSRLLLLDDSSVWQPPPQLADLWTYLRLLLLESIWVVRGTPAGQGQGAAKAIASRFIACLQQQVRQDWARVEQDIRLDAGVPLSWLRGRAPILAHADFDAKWPHSLVSRAGGRHTVALTVDGLP